MRNVLNSNLIYFTFQYEKEQEMYSNRAMVSKESKEKLELCFMYDAPAGKHFKNSFRISKISFYFYVLLYWVGGWVLKYECLQVE